MHRSPFGILMGKKPPLAASFEDIQQTVEDVVEIERAGFCLLSGSFQERTNTLKLLPRDVAGITRNR